VRICVRVAPACGSTQITVQHTFLSSFFLWGAISSFIIIFYMIAPLKKEEEIEMCEGVRMAELSGREAVNFVQPLNGPHSAHAMRYALLTPCAQKSGRRETQFPFLVPISHNKER
jgi:hypothetical protein